MKQAVPSKLTQPLHIFRGIHGGYGGECSCQNGSQSLAARYTSTGVPIAQAGSARAFWRERIDAQLPKKTASRRRKRLPRTGTCSYAASSAMENCRAASYFERPRRFISASSTSLRRDNVAPRTRG